MKLFLIILCSAALAWAQSNSTVYQRDINGRRSALRSSSATATGGDTQFYQSVNGRRVPLEETGEKVLSDTPRGKVTERITKKYGRDGQLIQTQRTVIEETKRPGGIQQVKETTYKSDVNGRMQEAERRTAETRVQGQTTTTNITIDRPSLDGTFAPTEKRRVVTTGAEANQQTTETVQRTDGNGGFRDMLREVTTTKKNGNQTVMNTASYEPDMNRQMVLARQAVTTTTRQKNGTETEETNLYDSNVPGVSRYPGAPMQLKEQQIIQRQPAADGSVVETFSVRRPTVTDPNHLGPVQQISQTVCVGKCLPDEMAAPPSAVTASSTTAESAAGADASQPGSDGATTTAQSGRGQVGNAAQAQATAAAQPTAAATNPTTAAAKPAPAAAKPAAAAGGPAAAPAKAVAAAPARPAPPAKPEPPPVEQGLN